MVVNRLQNGLINSIYSRVNRQNIFFSNVITFFFFFGNFDRDFYFENNNVSQVYT
jgi:hypothetical protein